MTSLLKSKLVVICQAIELEKETNLREPDECKIWIRKICQAKADYVDHLEEHLKPDAEALLARTARKYLINDVRQSFSRLNLAVNTVDKLTEAMTTMYSSKLSLFQYLKLVHEVKYTKAQALQGYISELTEVNSMNCRLIRRKIWLLDQEVRQPAWKESIDRSSTQDHRRPPEQHRILSLNIIIFEYYYLWILLSEYYLSGGKQNNLTKADLKPNT